MSRGREYLQKVNDALREFEDAIVQREHKRMLESKVPLQQEVDRARADVVDVVAKLVSQARLDQSREQEQEQPSP